MMTCVIYEMSMYAHIGLYYTINIEGGLRENSRAEGSDTPEDGAGRARRVRSSSVI